MEAIKQKISIDSPPSWLIVSTKAGGEITPPSDMPPIKKVLLIDGSAIVNCLCEKGNLNAQGTVTFTIIYLCEKGMVHSFESSAPFKHIEQAECDEGMRINATAKIGRIDFSLSDSTLKLEADVIMQCCIIASKEHAVIEQLKGESEQSTIPFASKRSSTISEQANIREEVRIPRSASKLLNVSGFARVNSAQIEGTKAQVDGTLRLNILLCALDGTMIQTPATLPFATRLDLPESTKKINVTAQVKAITANLIGDDIVSIEACIQLRAHCIALKELELLIDCYGYEDNILCEKVQCADVHQLNINSRSTFRLLATISTDAPAADRVLCCTLRPQVNSIIAGDGSATVKGIVFTSLVYVCAQGNFHSAHWELEFECLMEGAQVKKGMTVTAMANCELISAGGGREVALQVAMDMVLDCIKVSSYDLIDNISIAPRLTSRRGASIYFKSPEQTMWDIGKMTGMAQSELLRLNDDPSSNGVLIFK